MTLRVYLASPDNQMQANACKGYPVLLSFALASKKPFLERAYMASFDRVLLDSGAFSEFNSGVRVDLTEYVEWAQSIPWADNWAGLDDISGNYRRGLKNLDAGGFPTLHDSDPEEILPDLIDIARERGNWLGLGKMPPRSTDDGWVRRTLDRIPDDIHVHGWALGTHARRCSRINSYDSTHWWRAAFTTRKNFPFLTYAECLEIHIKEQQRAGRIPECPQQGAQEEMFGLG